MGVGGGGGASSGLTDFPAYMKTLHGQMLDNGGLDSFDLSICACVNEALTGDSPYFSYTTGQLTVDALMLGTGKVITDTTYKKPFDLLATVQALNFATLYDGYRVDVVNDDYTDSMLSDKSIALDDTIDRVTLPELHIRLRDTGMVLSSNFAIGESLVQVDKVQDLAQHRITVEELKMKTLELAMKKATIERDFDKSVVSLTLDGAKYYHTIKAERDDGNAEWKAKDKLWDIKLYQYAASVMGSISGSALPVDDGNGSKSGAAISGAFSGAATGTMVAGWPWGTVVGGVVGLAGGILSR